MVDQLFQKSKEYYAIVGYSDIGIVLSKHLLAAKRPCIIYEHDEAKVNF